MSITHRNGHINDYDKNKLTPFQWVFPSDGTIRCCISPGVEKIIATKEDLQQILTSSPEAYTALQQLLSDLELNPSELTNILSNISVLQTSKLDKVGDTKDNITTFTEYATDTDIASGEKHLTIFGKILKSIKTLRSGKIDKTSIGQTDIINDVNKVAGTPITYAHGQAIAAINNKLANSIAMQGFASTDFSTNYAAIDRLIGEVTIHMYLASAVNNTSVLTLSPEFRPTAIQYINFAGMGCNAAGVYVPIVAKISADGNVALLFPIQDTYTNVQLSFSFIKSYIAV